MIWVSSIATLLGITLALGGRHYEVAAAFRREHHEGPTALMGLGIFCMVVGGSLGILSGLTLLT